LRKTVFVAGALLALTAPPASAVGFELAWNTCYGQPGAVGSVQSTCDANTGSQTLVVSFMPPDIAKLEGVEVFVDFQLSPPGFCALLHVPDPSVALPCWWNFANGELRRDQLAVLHVSPTDANGNPEVACGNHYFLDRGAAGGGGMIVTGLGRGQFKGIAAIADGTGLPVAADAQQYACGFRILNGSTMPLGTCEGCTANLCFVLNTINLTSSTGIPSVTLQIPHPGSENWVSWRPLATPTLQHTWGQIKSLYR
jgi:hypothetical protein